MSASFKWAYKKLREYKKKHVDIQLHICFLKVGSSPCLTSGKGSSQSWHSGILKRRTIWGIGRGQCHIPSSPPDLIASPDQDHPGLGKAWGAGQRGWLQAKMPMYTLSSRKIFSSGKFLIDFHHQKQIPVHILCHTQNCIICSNSTSSTIIEEKIHIML